MQTHTGPLAAPAQEKAPEVNPRMKKDDQTILDRLARHAQRHPDRPAYRFLRDRGDLDCLTYGQLSARVAALAGYLREHAAAGNRALLLYPPGLAFIEAFLGCLAGGVIAVPAYPPRKNRSADRLLCLARDCSPRLLLTTRQPEPSLGPDLLGAVAPGHCLCTDTIETSSSPLGRLPAVNPCGIAFLQYTSGSTGNPRGVVVTHRNILVNEEAIRPNFGHTAESVVVSWVPVFHDMGLIGGVFQPLFAAIPGVFLAPAAFLQEPVRWLQAVTEYRATTTGGPNFAWEHCLRRVTEEQKEGLDLSSLRVAYNGAEPIRAETLDRFTAAFARCGFRLRTFFPCYGLAESTLFVSGGPPQRDPVRACVSARGLEEHAWVRVEGDDPADVRWLVSSGRVAEGTRVEVVHPETRRRCRPGEIGEIWIASGSVAAGYWNRSDESRETMQAVLADDGAGPFLRTGDLGHVEAGELFITGRLKDLIILPGRNIYPQDIEAVVERALAFAESISCAVFATETDGQEQLAVVVEATREVVRWARAAEENHAPDPPVSEAAEALEGMVGRIRAAVTEEFQVPVHTIVFVRPGTFPHTSSGKVQRRACRDGLRSGSLNVVYQWHAEAEECPGRSPAGGVGRTEQELRGWLQAQLQEVLKTPAPPRPETSFFEMGLDSLKAVELCARLQRAVGPEYPLSETLAFDYPTISRLERHLAERFGTAEVTGRNQAAAGPDGQDRVAVVGLACRLPGAPDAEAFWRLLLGGVDATTEVPPDRWDVDAYYDPDPGAAGKTYTRRGPRWATRSRCRLRRRRWGRGGCPTGPSCSAR
jgi:acyl-CoA synthetase (AMP-forming)/AMP-acid ligase II/acyl carrier protein